MVPRFNITHFTYSNINEPFSALWTRCGFNNLDHTTFGYLNNFSISNGLVYREESFIANKFLQ